MKKTFFIFLVLISSFFQRDDLSAQTRDTIFAEHTRDSVNQKNDSVNASILQKFNVRLEEIEKLRIADSITKAGLLKEINSLKTTDDVKKQELERQLEEVRNQEALHYKEKQRQIDSLRLTARAYPVLGFFNDTLFSIYNKSGSFTAQDRADAINQRIHDLTDVFRFTQDSIRIVNSENSTDLAYKDHIIISISDNDALWNNSTRQEMAEHYRKIIGDEITRYKKATSFKTILKEIALALLVIAIVILIIKYLSKFFRWTRLKIRQQKGKFIKGIRIRNYTLFDAGKEVQFFLNGNRIIKWVVIILVIYFALPILFGIFPWTKNFADTLLGYILNPVKKIGKAFIDFLPNLVTIVVIVTVFRWVFRGIKFLTNEIRTGQLKIPGFFADWANPTYQIVRVLVFAFMIVVIYPYLPGSGSPVFQGVSVFLGFLFTFGSAGSLSNIISGLNPHLYAALQDW